YGSAEPAGCPPRQRQRRLALPATTASQAEVCRSPPEHKRCRRRQEQRRQRQQARKDEATTWPLAPFLGAVSATGNYPFCGRSCRRRKIDRGRKSAFSSFLRCDPATPFRVGKAFIPPASRGRSGDVRWQASPLPSQRFDFVVIMMVDDVNLSAGLIIARWPPASYIGAAPLPFPEPWSLERCRPSPKSSSPIPRL